MSEEKKTKPTLPEAYVVPEVWTPPEGGSFMGNAPTAGARFEKDLPRGKHALQLYSLGTPNGVKATLLLEELIELGVEAAEYDHYTINIGQQEQFSSGFVAVNPNSKIPALLDYSEDASDPIRIFESGAILLYLANKFEKFIPSIKDSRARAECSSWLFWGIGSAPYVGGGVGHFYNYAPVHIEYCVNRFAMETKRLLDVLDKHLEGKKFILGDEYSIADMVNYPWYGILCTGTIYNAQKFLNVEEYKNIMRWAKDIGARAAAQRAVRVGGFVANAIKERHSMADFDIPAKSE